MSVRTIAGPYTLIFSQVDLSLLMVPNVTLLHSTSLASGHFRCVSHVEQPRTHPLPFLSCIAEPSLRIAREQLGKP